MDARLADSLPIIPGSAVMLAIWALLGASETTCQGIA